MKKAMETDMVNEEEKVIVDIETPEEEAPEAGAGAEEEVLPEEQTDWEAEAREKQDLYLRAQADMDNMRKRLQREKVEFIKFANEHMMKDLLSVLDNLERALDHANADGVDPTSILEGVRLTYDGFMNVLEKFGVKPVTALGERFDPKLHEAVMQREDPDVEENTVVEEVQKGYIMNDRLIRPSMVVVSRRPPDEVES